MKEIMKNSNVKLFVKNDRIHGYCPVCISRFGPIRNQATIREIVRKISHDCLDQATQTNLDRLTVGLMAVAELQELPIEINSKQLEADFVQLSRHEINSLGRRFEQLLNRRLDFRVRYCKGIWTLV